jgi:hypothetical protein
MGNSPHPSSGRAGISAPTQVLRGGLRNGDGADRNYIRPPIAGPGGRRHTGVRRAVARKR